MLGIMLVKIGIGLLFLWFKKEYKGLLQTAKMNWDWVLAKQYFDLEET